MNIEQQTIEFEVIRETSHYNKYIKWFLKCYREDGSLLSVTGHKTEKEARSRVVNSSTLMPIGDRFTQITYKERSK
ncbi:MAG: hypothetical protein IPJ03_15870 [Ignavibacteriales bacterium]|nr:hypothetical protein [Ignavibacteriales bacterium]